jgi:sugar (pentulose or hexulose) kinase
VRQGWLGVDIGTTSTKAVVYGDAGQRLGQARTPTLWSSSGAHTGIDPDLLLTSAVASANEAVAASADDVVIAGIGLASMGETGILVDAAGRPVTDAIAWHDRRDEAEVAALGDEIGQSKFEQRTGKPLRTQFSLTKHRWLVDHEPATANAVRRFNVAEWVARGLGAEECCELSLACRTGWYDLVAGTWDDELLSWSGARASLMPPIVEAGTAIGVVTAADAHPRLRGATVTLCGHDHQSAAVGCGAERTGDELDSSGTAEALVRTVDPTLRADEIEKLTRAGITVDVSIQKGRWSLLGGTQGGLVMTRALSLLGIDWPRLGPLDSAALGAPQMPGLEVSISGGSLKLAVTGNVTPAGVWRAVVDAVTREAVALHETMSSVAGTPGRTIAAGGWCASAMVLDAKRRFFGKVSRAAAEEPGTLGAAILAGRAAGHLRPTGRFGVPHVVNATAGTGFDGFGPTGPGEEK